MLALFYILSFICGAAAMITVQLIISAKKKKLKDKDPLFAGCIDLLNY